MGYTFGAQTTYAVGSSPRSVTAADVNGDGRLDLVSANANSNSVSVLLGTATGFAAQTTYAVSSTPVVVTVADVNRDGHLDLISANAGNGTVSVLLGTGKGFAAQTTYAVGGGTNAVMAADVNGDGRIDLVTTNAGSGTVSVLLSTTTGFTASFAAAATYAVGNLPTAVTAVDVNGDGRIDLVTTNRTSNSLSVLLGTATGFASQATYAVGNSPNAVTAVDVNGDGRIDLVSANADSNSVSVLLGTATGFAAQATYAVGGTPGSVTAMDVNGDGRLDLVTANSDSGSVSVLLGTATGFAGQTNYAVGGTPVSVTAADVNDDGHLDIISADASGGVSVLLGRPTIAVTGVTVTSPVPSGRPLKIGDTLALTLAIDQTSDGITLGSGATQPSLTFGNGGVARFTGYDAAGLHFDYTVQAEQDTNDLLLTGLSLNGALVSHSATVGFATQVPYALERSANTMTAADVNSDGRIDYVTISEGTSSISVILSTATGLDAQTTYFVGGAPQSVTAVDVNGDGRIDLVTTDRNGNNLSVLLGTATGFAAQVTYAVGDTPHWVTAADVDGDGRIDLVSANAGSNSVSVLFGTPTGFGAKATYAVGDTPFSVTAVDVNGDGRIDLVTANYGSGNVSVLLGRARGFAAQVTYAVDSNPSSVIAADVNGDGRIDLVTANAGSSDTAAGSGTVSVLLGTTTGFAAETTYAVGRFPSAITAADVNGDGRIDLVTANLASNSVSVLVGTATGFAAQATYAVGGLPSSLTAADVNGDGRLDLVNLNYSYNTVSVLLNTSTPGAALDASSFALSGGRDTALVVDATRPSVLSLISSVSRPTNAASLSATVTFSEAVTGVTADDFAVVGTGSATGRVATVTGSGTSYILALDQLAGDGTIHLDLKTAGTGIFDLAGNAISGGYTGTVTTTLDHTVPTAASAAATSGAGAAANAASTSYAVHFSEAVSGVDVADFALARTGSAGGSITGVSGSGADYTVTVSGLTGTGSLGLALASGANIADVAGNAVLATTGLIASTAHAIDRDTPGIVGLIPSVSGPTNAASLSATLTFSEAVTGVTADDFAVVGTGSATGRVASVSGAGSTYTVALDGLAGDGTIRLDLKASGTGILDLSGNAIGAGYTGTSAIILDHTAPTAPVLSLEQDTGTVGDRITRDAGLTLGGREAGTSLSYSLDGRGPTAGYVAPTADGTHTVLVTQTDAAGNVSTAGALTFTLDTVAPQAVLGGVSGAANRAGGHVLSGDLGVADAGLSVTIRDGTNVLGTAIADSQGHFAFAFSDTKDGASHAYTLSATVTDAAGNTGTCDSFVFHFDYAANRELFGTVAHDTSNYAGQVYALYEGLLAHAPDALGAQALVSALDRGISLRDVAQSLLTSDEGRAHLNAVNNADFVEQMYETVLGRHGEAQGAAAWTAYLDGGGDRAMLANQFVFSAENLAQLQPALQAGVYVADVTETGIARLYHGLLDRAPDGIGLAGWETAAHTGTTLTAIAQGFLGSSEYTAGHGNQTDAQFVEGLYLHGLGRAAEASGEAGWLSVLSHGATRADVAVGILQSAEAQQHWLGQVELGWHLA